MRTNPYVYLYTLFLIVAFSRLSVAQNISGFIYEKLPDNPRSPLVGVNVFWAGTTKGTFTDDKGKFRISKQGIKDTRLVVSMLGYRKDTIKVTTDNMKPEFELLPDEQQLGEVEVKGRQDDSFISKMRTQATTVITTGELQRAACCNLAESFETNASVDVSYSDAISGARQIQLLGLSGIYSQVMTENVPLLRGLATSYGLNYIPGSWMESIQVAKGTSSVVQGYESITGQINVEYKKPENSEKFFLNVYGNSNLRFEANADGAIKINDKLSTSLLVHAATFQNKFDRNDDGFMDLPKFTTITAMNRWDYIVPNKWVSRFGFKYLYEDRNGGQMAFDKNTWNTDTTGITNDSKKYGIGVKTNRLEGFWKNGIFLGPGAKSSLGLILSGINHQQDAFYGINLYHGHEQNFNANLIFTTSFNEGKHKVSTGMSYFVDDYSENYVQTRLEYLYQTLPAPPPDSGFSDVQLFTLVNDSVYTYLQDRNEWNSGLFFEYTYDLCNKFALIAGLRGDYNNQFGYLVTPRLHLRANLTKDITLRGSVGKGYRSPNLLAENSAVFVSQRVLYFAPNLGNEEAWNYGLNFTWNFKLFKQKAEFSIDAYRTSFVKQIIVDQDSLPTAVFFYNLDGKSYANSIQAQLTFSPVKQFNITAAFRLNDVKITEGGTLRQKALVNQYKGLLSLSYTTKFEKWKFDLTGQLNGPARIPDTDKMPVKLQRPDYSPVWINLLAQVTKKFKHFDIYLGGENLTNFRQLDPISEYWKPYHTHFDASMAWGPVVGIAIYAGIRLTIK
jgi:outer membrane receptor for ferrienterochelin and colicins